MSRKTIILVIIGILVVVGLIVLIFYQTKKTNEQTNKTPDNTSVEPVDFITTLPHTETDFTIQLVPDTGSTTLLVIPNISINGLSSPQDQLRAQWPTYQKYAQEALGYINTKSGNNLTYYNITYWYQDFWPTGYSIATIAP